MDFIQFVRRPFAVEAVQITKENMKEVATLIGNVRSKDGVTFILVNRRIVPNVTEAYIGWWLTRFGRNYRCYSPRAFKTEFIDYEPEIKFTFVDDGDEAEPEPPKPDQPVGSAT